MIYLGTYLLGALIFFIFSPIAFKHWGWRIKEFNDNPPPEVISLVWPFVVGGYILYFLFTMLFFILRYPFSIINHAHLVVAAYISDEASLKRKEKKLAKTAPPVAL